MYSCSIWKASSAADTGTEFKKVSNRAALMDIENVRRFVEEKALTALKHWKPLQYSKKLPRKKQRKSATEMEGKSGG